MAEWRFGHGWTEGELEARLRYLRNLDINFPRHGEESQEWHAGGKKQLWNRYYSEAIIGFERPGPPEPGGVLERAWKSITDYEFSDPDIVTAHFARDQELLGRDMLLEIKVLGLRYLCGTRVGAVREREKAGHHVRGYRYDTLEGHIERGSEWFMLTQVEKTGEVWFRIHASWRYGDFPNWWSRAGFFVLGRRYQLAWHRLAYLRLRELLGGRRDTRFKPVPVGTRLIHSGAEVADSDLWVLNEPLALQRVRAMGKQKKTETGELPHDQTEHKERDARRGLRSDLRDSQLVRGGGGGPRDDVSQGGPGA